MRRLFDLLVALFLIALTSPLWVIMIIAIPLTTGGSPFFLHKRIGKGGEPFRLVKFRTMSPVDGISADLTVSGDKRITVIGRILRRFKLDELPQLLNIVGGAMTFVGPRPEVAEFVEKFTPEQRDLLNYLPGLTDPASLKYRHEEKVLAGYPDPVAGYLSEVLPDKISLSLDYQRRRTVYSDLTIILKTIRAVFD